MTTAGEWPASAAPAIRAATGDDVPAIIGLLAGYARMGNLLPRSRSEIKANIDWFRVAQSGANVIGCGALEIFTPELAEIRSLVVNGSHKGSGVGRLLVERLAADARGRGHRRLMALTYSPGFFHRLGFKTVPKERFPEKIWGICVNCYKFQHCDEIAVLKYLQAD